MNDDKQPSAGTDELSGIVDRLTVLYSNQSGLCLKHDFESVNPTRRHCAGCQALRLSASEDMLNIIKGLQSRERALQEQLQDVANCYHIADKRRAHANDRIVQLEDRERELREENERLSGLLRDGQSVLNAANYTIDNQRESIRANETRIGELEADLEATRLERDSAEAYKVRTVEASRSGHDEMLAKLLAQLEDERALSARMFERVAGLSRALDSYGDHMSHCGATVTREEKDCTCGFTAALGDAK